MSAVLRVKETFMRPDELMASAFLTALYNLQDDREDYMAGLPVFEMLNEFIPTDPTGGRA